MTLNEYIDSLKDRSVTVIGAGVSNRPLIRRLCEQGIPVTVCDRAESLHKDLQGLDLHLHLGETYLQDLPGNVIFRTPGLHPDVPALKAARERGALVTSEMEVFLALCPCRVIAVTGSDGKTTTTSIIAELLRAAGHKVHLGGNIGTPLLCSVDEMSDEDIVVLELSSFQLHSMYCRPDVAVITNLSPNHLDVHPDYDDYINAKKQVYRLQRPGGRLVLNADNPDTAACASEAKGYVSWFSRCQRPERGFWLNENGILCRAEDNMPILPAQEVSLPGNHNIENTLAAFAAVDGLVPPATMAIVAGSFQGVSHRLEKVRFLRGVTFINDSIATSPNRTIAGLSCFKEKVILIAGGKDKGVPFDSLGESICEHVKRLYLTGMTAEKIKNAVLSAPNYRPGTPEIFVMEDFRETVEAAARAAREGDTVLLSPASTAFDKFPNFMVRGDTFRKIVEELE